MTLKVLHIAHYAASYKGNFVASLECLENRLLEFGGISIYMFPNWAKDSGAMAWISEMEKDGKCIYFFSGSFLLDSRLIRNIIKEHGINIIHTHFLPAKFQVSVKNACLLTSVRQVVHFHNHSENKKGLQRYLRKVFYNNSIMVACSNSVYKSICRDYPSNKKFSVDNGITVNRLTDYSLIKASELGIKNDYPICLMFGFDFERKGVDLACLAIQKLWDNGIKVNLVISLSRNQELIEEKITEMFGIIPEWLSLITARSDVASLYNSVDVFLSPSREEGLPYSVLEAAYSSCVVVLSDIEAQKLDIPYAMWFDSGDVDHLADKIVSALEIKNQKEENIGSVKKCISDRYSVDSWSEKILQIYQNILY